MSCRGIHLICPAIIDHYRYSVGQIGDPPHKVLLQLTALPLAAVKRTLHKLGHIVQCLLGALHTVERGAQLL
jgi:hypothetical protein